LNNVAQSQSIERHEKFKQSEAGEIINGTSTRHQWLITLRGRTMQGNMVGSGVKNNFMGVLTVKWESYLVSRFSQMNMLIDL